ncbi:CHAT domain-containing protein [Saccharothrix sp. HUAS TT1]|uniref:CHAT domain-containing protein n=1 Tax=unclassified Saccharothrix TaxID=2593673 RepID=UPI00345BED7A
MTPDRFPALVSRAEALLATGLVEEAGVLLRPAVGAGLPEALLLAARCALRDDDLPAAHDLAVEAEALFRRQDRLSSVPAARAVALRAGGRGSPGAVAEACDSHGHHEDAAELRLRHAPEEAATRRGRGTSRSRAIGWLARARLADTRRAAVAACRAGLALRDPELSADLVDIALDHALTSGDARSAWRWSERRPGGPPAEVARARAELRLARVRGDRDRVVRLERELVRVSRSSAGRPGVPLDDVVDALGDRALLVFISHRGGLVGVSVARRRVRLHDFGAAGTAARHVRSLSLADAPHRAAELDRLLRPAGDRAVVVVPSPELAGLPWAALPSARGRAVSVAPSTGCWHRANSRTPALGERLWAAGPSLVHARREVEVLRGAHGGSVRSTVGGVVRGMGEADVVHIAAHGVRQDELFSYLQLEDGPLHGHRFEFLDRVPSVVVLSACESGLARVLLRRGARVVVESVRAVPDDRVVDVMVDLHAGLAHPAQALADAQARHGDLGFVCMGAG